ncbi:MAG: HTH domain-containing protein [Phycisphaerales bacterium]
MSYTFLDLAVDVLQTAQTPMTYQEIWQAATDAHLTEKLNSKGKTPWDTLASQLYVEVRDNPTSRFIGVGKRPVRFFLKQRERELDTAVIQGVETSETTTASGRPSAPMVERDLHPLLAYYAYANPSFNRGRAIHTKTIYHEKSKKAGYNEWVHPDMVGFYLPLEDWQTDVIELNEVSDNNALRLYSFELKRYLDKSNYREAYFQAVSNSSWAHEGYLVAADVLDDDEFRAELDRLASAFGIGIIELDPDDVDASRVLFPARRRPALDWETMNKLCTQNPDFAKFLHDVKIDFKAREVHNNKYDKVRSPSPD